MNTTYRFTRTLPWIARITGSLLLTLLLFMLVGHLAGFANGSTFLFFPVCTIFGLGIADIWERIGGAIAVGGRVTLFALRTDLMQAGSLAMMVPGLLYLAHGWTIRKAKSGS